MCFGHHAISPILSREVQWTHVYLTGIRPAVRVPVKGVSSTKSGASYIGHKAHKRIDTGYCMNTTVSYVGLKTKVLVT